MIFGHSMLGLLITLVSGSEHNFYLFYVMAFSHSMPWVLIIVC